MIGLRSAQVLPQTARRHLFIHQPRICLMLKWNIPSAAGYLINVERHLRHRMTASCAQMCRTGRRMSARPRSTPYEPGHPCWQTASPEAGLCARKL